MDATTESHTKNQLSQKLRDFMRQDSHGMTIAGLAESVKASPDSVRRSLKLMPDTYIAEWVLNVGNGRFTSVWKIITPPADAPEPDENHPRFKPCNPNWMTDLRREPRKQLHRAMKPVSPELFAKPVKRKNYHPEHKPQKTNWVPVAPWPKGMKP
jgi:hypothetical protein